MPMMDGYEATRQIKQMRHKLPVIMQTAYYDEMDINKALACGCDDYITKPINRQALFSKISKQLEKAV